MHVALIINALEAGGAERVISLMSNYWVERGVRVTLFTFDDGKKPPHYVIREGVQRQPLDIDGATYKLSDALRANVRRLKTLRRAIKAAQPDIVISFLDQTNILTVLSTRGTGIPAVISERNNPAEHFIPRVWRVLRRVVYPLAEHHVFQNERVSSYYGNMVRRKAAIIPNPVLKPAVKITGEVSHPRPGKKIIGVGRLERQKGFDLLIKAFARIAERQPGWQLEIWGQGSCREALQQEIEANGLSGRVTLKGMSRTIHEELVKADIFVMASRFEGFPNALCEAMTCGLAVISADCMYGPREIIRPEIDGLLVPPENVEELAEAMNRLMSNGEERRQLGLRAQEITDRFGLPVIMKQWDELLEKVLAETKGLAKPLGEIKA